MDSHSLRAAPTHGVSFYSSSIPSLEYHSSSHQTSSFPAQNVSDLTRNPPLSIATDHLDFVRVSSGLEYHSLGGPSHEASQNNQISHLDSIGSHHYRWTAPNESIKGLTRDSSSVVLVSPTHTTESNGPSLNYVSLNSENLKLKEELAILNSKIQNFEKTQKESHSLLESAELSLVQLKKKVEELEKENKDLAMRGLVYTADPETSKTLQEATRERDQLLFHLKELQKKIEELQTEKNKFQGEKQGVSKRMKELEEKNQSKSEELDKKTREIQEVANKANRLKLELQITKEKLSKSELVINKEMPRLQNELAKNKIEMERKDRRIVSFEFDVSRISSLEKSLKALSDEGNKLKEVHEALLKSSKATQAELAESRKLNESLKIDLDHLNSTASCFPEVVQKLSKKNRRMGEELYDLDIQLKLAQEGQASIADWFRVEQRTKELAEKYEGLLGKLRHSESENERLRMVASSEEEKNQGLSEMLQVKTKEANQVERKLKEEIQALELINKKLMIENKKLVEDTGNWMKEREKILQDFRELASKNELLERHSDDLLKQIRLWSVKVNGVEGELAQKIKTEEKAKIFIKEFDNLRRNLEQLRIELHQKEASLSELQGAKETAEFTRGKLENCQELFGLEQMEKRNLIIRLEETEAKYKGALSLHKSVNEELRSQLDQRTQEIRELKGHFAQSEAILRDAIEKREHEARNLRLRIGDLESELMRRESQTKSALCFHEEFSQRQKGMEQELRKELSVISAELLKEKNQKEKELRGLMSAIRTSQNEKVVLIEENERLRRSFQDLERELNRSQRETQENKHALIERHKACQQMHLSQTSLKSSSVLSGLISPKEKATQQVNCVSNGFGIRNHLEKSCSSQVFPKSEQKQIIDRIFSNF